MQQRDARGAVRVVLDRRDLRGNAVLVALEVDDAVLLLVAAADEARGDPALAVAAAGLRLALGQRLLRRRLGDVLERRVRREPDARRRRLVVVLVAIVFLFIGCVRLHALEELGRLLAFLEPDVGLAPVAALAAAAAHPLHLSADVEEADLFDLDLEQLFDGLLDLDLVGVRVDLEGDDVRRPRGASSTSR